MKKLVLAVVWLAQYALAIAGFIAQHRNDSVLSLQLLVIAFVCLPATATMLGIGKEMKAAANAQIPGLIELLWKIACIAVFVIVTINIPEIQELVGVSIPVKIYHGIILYFGAAAVRDIFLVRYYFAQEL